MGCVLSNSPLFLLSSGVGFASSLSVSLERGTAKELMPILLAFWGKLATLEKLTDASGQPDVVNGITVGWCPVINHFTAHSSFCFHQ